MTLDILQKEMIQAMKSQNKVRKDAISSLVGAIKKAAIDKGCRDNVPETLVDEVILKEKKAVQEMIDTCPFDRGELKLAYEQRLQVVMEFAPVLLTDRQEIRKRICTLLFEKQIEVTAKNRGQIMKTVMPAMKGKADMKIVTEVIKEMLE